MVLGKFSLLLLFTAFIHRLCRFFLYHLLCLFFHHFFFTIFLVIPPPLRNHLHLDTFFFYDSSRLEDLLFPLPFLQRFLGFDGGLLDFLLCSDSIILDGLLSLIKSYFILMLGLHHLFLMAVVYTREISTARVNWRLCRTRSRTCRTRSPPLSTLAIYCLPCVTVKVSCLCARQGTVCS